MTGQPQASSPMAGKPATSEMLVNVPVLITAYYSNLPDASVPGQRVAFGTSGHRGSAFANSFNEWHVLAISQAICEYRKQRAIDGPLYLGIDTHAPSAPAADYTARLMPRHDEVPIPQEDAHILWQR